jgi:hypothetical protein
MPCYNLGSHNGNVKERKMILKYESDILDDENARGNFYHVCQGKVQDTPVGIPPEDQPYECPACGIDLEQEDFLLAQQRGWS